MTATIQIKSDSDGDLPTYLPRVDLIGVGKAGWDAVQSFPTAALLNFRFYPAAARPDPPAHLALLVVTAESTDEATMILKELEASNTVATSLFLSTAGTLPGSFIRCAPGGEGLAHLVSTLRQLFFGSNLVGSEFMDYQRMFRRQGEIRFTEYHLPAGEALTCAGEYLGKTVSRTLINENETVTILLIFSFGDQFASATQPEMGVLWHTDKVLRILEDQLQPIEIDFLFAGNINEREDGLNIKMFFG